MTASPRNDCLRLAFYGDDFTGSTDALEVLAFAGLRCALFLSVPSAQDLRELGPFDAIGVAGDSRGMSPLEMDERLPEVFAALAALPVPLVHYKVCSTFDSAPAIGSIGHVMGLARRAFGEGVFPIVAATPALGRYCTFGNLFARSGTDGRIYRIDHHPIMSAHPITPMGHGDLVQHLALQTPLPIARFELPLFELPAAAMDEALDKLLAAAPAGLLFDGTTAAHLTATGRLLERLCRRDNPPVFAIGSSGTEYALTQWWRQQGRSAAQDADTRYGHFEGVNQVLAISGSASALSALQIDAALAAGFADVPVDASALVGDSWQTRLDALADELAKLLLAGRSVMLHTARGKDDPRIGAVLVALAAQGHSPAQARHAGGRLLGQRLGLLADRILRAVPLRRLVLSGGDTSSQVMQALGPQALEVAARLAPGAPLCRLLSSQPHLQGLQVALKGGQMGTAGYFLQALQGATHRPHP